MTERYKPETKVVRQNTAVSSDWTESNAGPSNHPSIPRALLITGVPMVGERVEGSAGDIFTVTGHVVLVEVDGVAGFHPNVLRPAPTQEEEEVEAVAKTLKDVVRPTLSNLDGAARAKAREIIAALDAVRRGREG